MWTAAPAHCGLDRVISLGYRHRPARAHTGFLGEAYAERAYGQYVRQTSLSAKRGSLLDRRGTEMATDVKARSFYARPEHVQDPEAVANFFARLNGVNSEKIVGQLSGERSFVYLARQVDAAAVDARRFVCRCL